MYSEDEIHSLIQQAVERKFQERQTVLHQGDILPQTIKRGHLADKIIVFGLLADRPASDATGISAYFATDNSTLYLWNGSSWAVAIGNDLVTNAMLRESAGLSVIGRSANTTGNPADIVGTDGQVLRVSGTALGFGTVATAGIADAAVTGTKISTSAIALGGSSATTNQGSITTEVDLTDLSATVTVPTGGRRAIIEGYVSWSNTGASGRTTLYIKESTTYLQNATAPNQASFAESLYVKVDGVPSSGSHTYKLAMETTAGTTTLVASSTVPAQILVTLI